MHDKYHKQWERSATINSVQVKVLKYSQRTWVFRHFLNALRESAELGSIFHHCRNNLFLICFFFYLAVLILANVHLWTGADIRPDGWLNAGGCYSICFLEGKHPSFEFDASRHWQPGEGVELRCVMSLLRLVEHQMYSCLLNPLQRLNSACW